MTVSPYPVVFASQAWDLAAMLEVTMPGIQHDHDEDDDGTRTAYLWHSDGSWARATSQLQDGTLVHQGGPRRLWTHLDDLRHHWLTQGELPVRGAKVGIRPDGQIILRRGGWKATIQ